MAVAIFLAVERISVRESSGMSVRVRPWCLGITRAWPLLRGWMSRKAKTLSDSKSLKEGMSPGGKGENVLSRRVGLQKIA